MQVQIIITLALIAVAAAIALFCDFLRAKNTQLRQAMAALEACNHARSKMATGLEGAPTRKATRERPTRKRSEMAESRPQIAAQHALPLQRQNKDERMTSTKALSSWLIERAAARAAQKTVEQSMASEPAVPEPAALCLPAPDRVLKPFAVPARPVPVNLPVNPPVNIDAYLWESLSATESEMAMTSRPGTTFELIQGTGAIKLDLDVPAGMHGANVLQTLTESRKLFTGQVISIGVSQADSGGNGDQNVMDSIESFVSALLRQTDFGCRLNAEEFLIICPGPHDAEAQRHLSHVSERLWDFQLRTLGKVSILFSVGGMDVQREALSEAIAIAAERMRQTRRSRTAGSARVALQHRKAV